MANDKSEMSKQQKVALCFSFIYVCLGIAFLAFSGRAEGLGSARGLIALFVPIAALHVVLNVGWLMTMLFSANNPSASALMAPIVGVALFASLIFAGFWRDGYELERTKQRAETITTRILSYYRTNGACPETLDSLFKPNEKRPKPTLKASTFRYSAGIYNACYLRFDAPWFETCNWDSRSKEWYCMD